MNTTISRYGVRTSRGRPTTRRVNILPYREVKIEDGEDGALIESIDYLDKEFRSLVKEIANDETLLL